MSEDVKRRRYVSPRREDQARSTRVAILDSAQRLFAAKGYVGTSIREIAAEAGVAEPTVYAAFKDKPSILWGIGERLVLEGESDIPFADSKVAHSIGSAPNLRGRLENVMKWSLETYGSGILELDEVVRQAVAADPRLKDLWLAGLDSQLEQGQVVVELLMEVAQLKPGFTPEEVRDLLVTINGPAVFRMLVRELGWPLEKYGRWMIEIAESFFEATPEQGTPPSPTRS